MKRKMFVITYGDSHCIKNAWNTAIREIENIVREIARIEHTEYNLVDSVSNKVGHGHVSGSRSWQSKNRNIVFNIQEIPI